MVTPTFLILTLNLVTRLNVQPSSSKVDTKNCNKLYFVGRGVATPRKFANLEVLESRTAFGKFFCIIMFMRKT